MPDRWDEIKEARGVSEKSDAYRREQYGMQLARIMRHLRQVAGLTQEELAAHIGVTQPQVARIERGASIPTLETLDRVAKALDRHLVIGMLSTAELDQDEELRRREAEGEVAAW